MNHCPQTGTPNSVCASRAARLPPDILQPCDEAGIVEVSVRDFLLACDPSPEELAEVDRKRKELGLNPLFEDDS